MRYGSSRSVPGRLSVLGVLRAARALVAKGWTKCRFARDKSGREVGLHSDRACGFCADWALRRVTGASRFDSRAQGNRRYVRAFRVMSGVVPGGILPLFNDLPTTTKADVLDAFDRAIAKAGGR